MAKNDTDDLPSEQECAITGLTSPFEITLDIYVTAIITSVINGLTAFSAIAINVIVIYSITRNVNLRRKSSNALILCLAITDGIIGVISQPLLVTRRVFVLMYKQEQCLMIVIFNSISSVCSGCSLATLPIIGFERYMSVVHPIKHRNNITSGKILGIVSVVWFVVFCLAVQVYFGSSYESYSLSVSAVILVSLVSCLGFYIAIFRRILSQNQRLHSNMGAAMQENQKREYKIAKNMAIIMLVMLLCYAPSMLAFTMNEHFGERIWWWEKVFPWTDTLLFVNSTLNPLLFCWKNKDLRREVTKVARCRAATNEIQPIEIS